MKLIRQHKKQNPQPAAQTAQSKVVAYRPPDPFAPKETVQPKVVEKVHKKNKHDAAALYYEKALDEAVDKSFMHVVNAPKLGIEVDGHTDKWQEDWDNHMNKKQVDLFAASFGYAIESLATNIYLPPAPGDYTIALQGVRGNTRPDVILQHKGEDVAWLDITAENSKGHIWKKGPPYWKDAYHASEIAYPSLDGGYLTLMEKNNNNKAPKNFNANAFKQQLQMAKKLSQMREERWSQMGNEIYQIWGTSKKKYGYVSNDLSPKLNKQSAMMLLLYQYFKLDFKDLIARPGNRIDPSDKENEDVYITDNDVKDYEPEEAARFRDEVGHILVALGINSTGTYGCNGGSRNRGRAWLMQFDKGIPQMSDLIALEEKKKNKDKKDIIMSSGSDNKDKMNIEE